jgi:CBS domain-containing protein
MPMIASDIMTRVPVAIAEDAPLSQAVRLMLDHRVSGLPVTDAQGALVGILTEGDLLRRVEIGSEGEEPGWFSSLFRSGRLAEDYVRTHGRRVSEVMTPDVVAAAEDTTVAEIAETMARERIKRIPILRAGRLVGIASRADLLRVLGAALDRTAPKAPDDAAIRQHILDEIKRTPWLGGGSVSVAVEDGKVLLDGCVVDLRQRAALRVVAENAPGARRVENRLVCIDPTSGFIVYDPSEDEGDQPEPAAPPKPSSPA